MKKINFQLVLFLFFSFTTFAQNQDMSVFSPSKNIEVKVSLRDKIYYSVLYEGKYITLPSPLSMTLVGNQSLGVKPEVISQNTKEVNSEIKQVWGNRSQITDHYTELELNCKGNYKVVFRAYNNAVAYRFETNLKQKITVKSEEVDYRFKDWNKGWFSKDKSYETSYQYSELYQLPDSQRLYLPCLIEAPTVNVVLTEANVIDYPSMQLRHYQAQEGAFLGSSFDKCPTRTEIGGFNDYVQVVKERADYIALTDGKRDFPWRIMVLEKNQYEIPFNDIVYKLARPLKLTDTSWIKPGKVAWDWWSDYAVEGVDFEGGINTEYYLYLADFAARHKMEYMIVDWKWTDKYDLALMNPEVDMQKIVNYAKSKNVAVIVWCPAFTLDNQLEKSLDTWAAWGIAGVKVDFFDRHDQLANQMYERMAAATAKRKMIIDFHGAATPSGLNRAYPNVLNYEAVLGNENNKWSKTITPKHTAVIPFLRMLNGTMDFTAGGMRNCTPGSFSAQSTLPNVQGTRCHEMALFLLYNETLKMLCDAPMAYEKEPIVLDFLLKMPTVWEETIPLNGKCGEFLLAARKTGQTWYVGGITNENKRSVDVNLSFLYNGKYQATIFQDGVNAKTIGTDYKIKVQEVDKNTILNLPLEASGGVVIRIEKR